VSCPSSFADWIGLMIAAARWPARRDPAKSHLLRARTTGVIHGNSELVVSAKRSQTEPIKFQKKDLGLPSTAFVENHYVVKVLRALCDVDLTRNY